MEPEEQIGSLPVDPYTYSGRLRIAIEQSLMTVRDLAKRLDVSTQSLYKVLRGESKSLQASRHLQACQILGIEPRWLSDGTEPMKALRKVTLGEDPAYPAIRHVGVRFSAGITGYEVQQLGEEEAQPIVFRASWFKSRGYRPDRLVAVTIEGDSMEPTLYAGDLVVINLEDTGPVDGEVYACRYEEQLVVKRLFREGGAWWLHSDNPDQRRHPRRAASESVEIIGRVIYRQSERL